MRCPAAISRNAVRFSHTLIVRQRALLIQLQAIE